MYNRVAQHFAEDVQRIFATEASLEATFKKRLPALTFSRTDYWGPILAAEFSTCFRTYGTEVPVEPTTYDRQEVLKYLVNYLDFNLFSQVLLNLQSYTGIAYSAAEADKVLEGLRAKWEGRSPSPFDDKPKLFKQAASIEEKEFNQDLSATKALRIISNFSPQCSFRVTPKGSTPALVDSKNLSMIGAGGDQFLRLIPGLIVSYLVWQDEPQFTTPEGVGFRVKDIPYLFSSKSGGEVLNSVLFSRCLAVQVYRGLKEREQQTVIVLPRMYSVMVVTGSEQILTDKVFPPLKQSYPMLTLAKGFRSF